MSCTVDAICACMLTSNKKVPLNGSLFTNCMKEKIKGTVNIVVVGFVITLLLVVFLGVLFSILDLKKSSEAIVSTIFQSIFLNIGWLIVFQKKDIKSYLGSTLLSMLIIYLIFHQSRPILIELSKESVNYVLLVPIVWLLCTFLCILTFKAFYKIKVPIKAMIICGIACVVASIYGLIFSHESFVLFWTLIMLVPFPIFSLSEKNAQRS